MLSTLNNQGEYMSDKELTEIINNDYYVLRPDDEQSYIDEFVGNDLVGE